MLYTIAVVLLILWLLGLVTSYTVGGAVVGNQVEGNMKATTSYEVHVRMDNGTNRTFHLQNLNGYNSGDRIKVINGGLRHAG